MPIGCPIARDKEPVKDGKVVYYRDVLPIRASAYILSLVNEQVSKGAIAVYLGRRHGIPAWEVGSSMLFIMFCEYFYLLGWATVGVLLQWERFPKIFHAIPGIALPIASTENLPFAAARRHAARQRSNLFAHDRVDPCIDDVLLAEHALDLRQHVALILNVGQAVLAQRTHDQVREI